MRVRLTSPAEAELDDALAWYSGIREGLAARFLDEFERLLERLRDNPHQFPRVRRDVRRAGFRRHLPLDSPVEDRSSTGLSAIAAQMNATPRKCLGWQTPEEVFSERLATIAGTG